MRRRQFIKLLGGAAWPLAARAQQSERPRHIGVLMAFSESDPEAQSWTGGFREDLAKLGWTEGHNIQIDIRWATADVESLERSAKQLVALQAVRQLHGHSRRARSSQTGCGGSAC
jgi:putative ABC transport system substrate-binding protein